MISVSQAIKSNGLTRQQIHHFFEKDFIRLEKGVANGVISSFMTPTQYFNLLEHFRPDRNNGKHMGMAGAKEVKVHGTWDTPDWVNKGGRRRYTQGDLNRRLALREKGVIK